jgi:hypothetical protein
MPDRRGSIRGLSIGALRSASFYLSQPAQTDLLCFFGPRLFWVSDQNRLFVMPLTERLSDGSGREGPTYRSVPTRRVSGRCIF